MTTNNNLELFTNGKVTIGDGREFTRLIGGFGENNSILTDKQVSELLGYKDGPSSVRRLVERNIEAFEIDKGVYIKDIQRSSEQRTFVETLISTGYAKQSITQAKNIYIFSKAGFLLFLYFAEGNIALETYKDFIEDYFQTKSENVIMKQTLQEELEFLKEQKITAVGRVICEPDEAKKIEWFQEAEKLNTRIKDIEITLSNEKLMKSLEPTIAIADSFTNTKGSYDVGVFSKILNIKGLGRNNLFAWLREKEILMDGNYPYQKFINYFKVLPVENKFTGRIDYKTMIKPNGIVYIVKKLIEDKKLITKSIPEILAELDAISVAV